MKLTLPNLDVSRETMERLETYEALLHKWNPKINLVARSTLGDAVQRHFIDSAQIWSYAPNQKESWLDIGSGGGFPGLVIAIIAHELSPSTHVTLIESDQRKCTFLRTVLRETGVAGTVLSERVESSDPKGADVLSARALTDLTTLLSFADRHLRPGGTCLFPKGANWEKEVNEALKSWFFNLNRFTSETDPSATILKIENISHE